MAEQLPISKNGEWTVLIIKGKKERPEAAHAGMIKFPGGDVNVTRTEDGNYWVHICVNNQDSGFFIKGETVPAIITGRLDIIGEGVKNISPNANHLAFLIKPEQGALRCNLSRGENEP